MKDTVATRAFFLLIMIGPVVPAVLWTMRFPRKGQRSLRELFWLVAYWCVIAAVYSAFFRWREAQP
jgi:hypothetical protein